MKLKRLTALLLAGCLITPNIGRVIAVENTGNQAETGHEDTNDGIKDDSNPEDENNNSGNEGEEGNNPGTGNEGTGDGSEDNSNPEDGNGSESSGTEGEDETDNEGNGETENPGEGEDNTEGEVIEPEDPNQLPEGEENNEELTEETDEIIEYAENAIFVSATGSDSNSGETEEEPVITMSVGLEAPPPQDISPNRLTRVKKIKIFFIILIRSHIIFLCLLNLTRTLYTIKINMSIRNLKFNFKF